MSQEAIFEIILDDGYLKIFKDNELLYISKMENIIERMNMLKANISFDLFVFSEILEFNDSIVNNVFYFSKAFLLFAKEINNGSDKKKSIRI